MSGNQRVVVFLKAPRPGSVKTRLGAEIGPVAATAAYRQLVDRLLERLHGRSEVEIRFTPHDAREEILPWVQPGWLVRPQGPGDLGERMLQSFLAASAEGVERTLLIGSDCPDVTVHDLEEGWAALLNHEVVLGPARDGGYWLIGLRRGHVILFEGLEWSGPTVLSTTLDRARDGGLSVALLRELEDVDTGADWRRYLAREKQELGGT